MPSRFPETVERPLRLILNQELLESHRPVPPSCTFDASPSGLSPGRCGVERILVPTDFSDFSTNALRYARLLAGRLGAEVLLVHVCPATSPDTFAGFAAAIEARREDRLKFAGEQMEHQLMETEAASPAGARPVRTILCEGSAHKCLVLLARSQDVDLLVTAKHGHSSAESHFLLGKTAEFLVRNAHCPVLLVGNEGAVFPAALDGREP